MLTYKRKLKLTKAQEKRIDSWTGACRTVYNMSLEIRISTYKNINKYISKGDLIKQLKYLKDIDWMKDVPSQSLVDSVNKLDRAYKTFFKTYKTGGGFPKFKSKKNYNSILFRYVYLKDKNTITIPKIGYLKMFKDSEIKGRIKTATIKKEQTGYYIYVFCDKIARDISNGDESQVIGLDMGVAKFCVDSNGSVIENPRHFKKYEAKLRVENRSLSRKVKNSNRWKKQARKVGDIHRKITNVRRDFLHKESTKVAKKYHTVYLEDLNINKMAKNKKYSKQILDCGWGIFRTMLSYKTNVIKIDPKFTSQTCNECGAIDSKSRLSQSEFVCSCCGHIDNADINAAKNILSKGIALNRKREQLGCASVEES